MKLVVERDRLKQALSVVIRRTKTATAQPILSHVLIEANANRICLTGHDLDSCSQVTIDAEVERTGSVAFPADRLNRLIAGLAEGSQVTIDAGDRQAKVRAGRSTYQFAILPAADFPEVLSPKDPVIVTLSSKEINRLFGMPSPCISSEKSRIYLHGIYLHAHSDKIAACATDGHTLLRTMVDAAAPKFAGTIVPGKSCDEFVWVAGDEDATFEITQNLIAIEARDRRFVTKLIDATFPDYERVIPQGNVPAMTMESAVLDAALARVVAACDPDRFPAVRLSWDDGAARLKASLQTTFGEGNEEIECDSQDRSAGAVGANVDYLRKLIDAMGGKLVRLYVAGPGDAIRFENPDDPNTVAVCMPCRV